MRNRTIAILFSVCLLSACQAIIKINPDGSCEIYTARTIAVSCGGATVVTGKVALSDETVQKMTEQAGAIVRERQY